MVEDQRVSFRQVWREADWKSRIIFVVYGLIFLSLF